MAKEFKSCATLTSNVPNNDHFVETCGEQKAAFRVPGKAPNSTCKFNESTYATAMNLRFPSDNRLACELTFRRQMRKILTTDKPRNARRWLKHKYQAKRAESSSNQNCSGCGHCNIAHSACRIWLQ